LRKQVFQDRNVIYRQVVDRHQSGSNAQDKSQIGAVAKSKIIPGSKEETAFLHTKSETVNQTALKRVFTEDC
jgi:hypothetical protein